MDKENVKETRIKAINKAIRGTPFVTLGLKLRKKDNEFTASTLAEIVSGERIATTEQLILIAETVNMDPSKLIRDYNGRRGDYKDHPLGDYVLRANQRGYQSEEFDPNQSREFYAAEHIDDGPGEIPDDLFDLIDDSDDDLPKDLF